MVVPKIFNCYFLTLSTTAILRISFHLVLSHYVSFLFHVWITLVAASATLKSRLLDLIVVVPSVVRILQHVPAKDSHHLQKYLTEDLIRVAFSGQSIWVQVLV